MKKLALVLIVVLSFAIPWVVYGADFQNSGSSSASTASNDAEVVGIIIIGTITIIYGMLFLIIPSLICALAAKRKGYGGFGVFMFSMLFTPIIGFLAVIAFPPKQDSGISKVKFRGKV